jgi:hypothetical protein
MCKTRRLTTVPSFPGPRLALKRAQVARRSMDWEHICCGVSPLLLQAPLHPSFSNVLPDSFLLSYTEIPNESHWFDGIVSSLEVRAFLGKQLVRSGPPKDAYQDRGFTLTVANVDETGSKGGWRITELDQPGR